MPSLFELHRIEAATFQPETETENGLIPNGRPTAVGRPRKEGGKEMSISRQELIDSLANMTVLELSQLIKDLEEKFGVSAAAPMAMAAVAAPAAAAAAPVEEEKTEFD